MRTVTIAFTTAPVLKPFDRELETIMETDASNQAIAGVLSQYVVTNGVKRLHPVDHHAKTLSATERNWPIHDKELWAIVSCFRRWHSWLAGIPIKVYTDHQGLQYFNTKRRLNSRQASWNLELSAFTYTIHYRPGKAMGKPDALTRRTGEEKSGADERIFEEGQLSIYEVEEGMRLLEMDGIEVEEAAAIELDGIDCARWERDQTSGLLIVPEEFKHEVFKQCHDSKVAGQWGRHRTQELVSRNFVWLGWREDVARYVASYKKCQKSKSDRHARQTKLTPMPTGTRPFEEIAMDFVEELPESEGYNAILVITDRFTKTQRYIPIRTNWTAEDVANAYICHIW